jgi:hypothetical protein
MAPSKRPAGAFTFGWVGWARRFFAPTSLTVAEARILAIASLNRATGAADPDTAALPNPRFQTRFP